MSRCCLRFSSGWLESSQSELTAASRSLGSSRNLLILAPDGSSRAKASLFELARGSNQAGGSLAEPRMARVEPKGAYLSSQEARTKPAGAWPSSGRLESSQRELIVARAGKKAGSAEFDRRERMSEAWGTDTSRAAPVPPQSTAPGIGVTRETLRARWPNSRTSAQWVSQVIWNTETHSASNPQRCSRCPRRDRSVAVGGEETRRSDGLSALQRQYRGDWKYRAVRLRTNEGHAQPDRDRGDYAGGARAAQER